MDKIDQIYYTATTTQLSPDGAMTGYTVTTANYSVPALNFACIVTIFIVAFLLFKLTFLEIWKD